MSHLMVTEARIKDLEALRLACVANETELETGDVRGQIYQTAERGVAMFTPHGWRFPVVVRADGALAYDNFQGTWGDAVYLDRILRDYDCEALLSGLAQQGWSLTSRHQNENGEVILEVCAA